MALVNHRPNWSVERATIAPSSLGTSTMTAGAIFAKLPPASEPPRALSFPGRKSLPTMIWRVPLRQCSQYGRRCSLNVPSGRRRHPRDSNRTEDLRRSAQLASVAPGAPRERFPAKRCRLLPAACPSVAHYEVVYANRGVEFSAPVRPTEQLQHSSGRARCGRGRRWRAGHHSNLCEIHVPSPAKFRRYSDMATNGNPQQNEQPWPPVGPPYGGGFTISGKMRGTALMTTNTVTGTRTALMIGAIGLLMLVASACGDGSNAPAAQSEWVDDCVSVGLSQFTSRRPSDDERKNIEGSCKCQYDFI